VSPGEAGECREAERQRHDGPGRDVVRHHPEPPGPLQVVDGPGLKTSRRRKRKNAARTRPT
jgi:hypothetical protein